MKKQIKKIICAAMILVVVLSLTACGNASQTAPAVTEVGTYKMSKLMLQPFSGATLVNASFNSLTLYSDNTFVLTNIADTGATSDFESLHRSAVIEVVAYGTYEVASSDKELQESTIRIKSVTRVINGNTDTNTATLDQDIKDFVLTKNGAVGSEIIVNDNDHTMTNVSILDFRLGTNPDPQQEAMAQMFWGNN